MDPLAPPAVFYPGKIIKFASKDNKLVTLIQNRLNELGVGPIGVDGDFGKETLAAVKLFQARFTDNDGLPLKVDGEIGSLTWAAMFGEDTVTVTTSTTNALLRTALEFAAAEEAKKIREVPLGSNRGPRVDEYIIRTGLRPPIRPAWCVCFIYFCFDEAAKKLGRKNPLIKTAGVLDHWSKAGKRGIPRISTTRAYANPALIKPGHIFIMDFGGGKGHAGFVERVTSGKLITIEGNSNEGGSREGIGVFRRNMRTIKSINKGFVDYSSL